MWIRTGTFQKETSGVASATNAITGLPGKPKAIILFITSAVAMDTPTANAQIGYGTATSGGQQDVFASTSDDAVLISAGRRGNLNKALALINSAGTTLIAADAVMDRNGFTLTWTTNTVTGYQIGYIAIGGNGVSANIVEWTTSAAFGNQSIAGVGFQPDAVLHLYGQVGAASTAANARSAMGAMCSDGSQWALQARSGTGLGTSDTARAQLTNAAMVVVTTPGAIQQRFDYFSMDADGFTVNWIAPPSGGNKMISLCLKGVSAKAISFNKSATAAPTTQAVTGVGFKPKAVIFGTVSDVADADGNDHHRISFGASAAFPGGSTEFALLNTDQDLIIPTQAKAAIGTGKSLVTCDNGAGSYDSVATVQSFDADGFTLSFPTTNDAEASQIVALALSGPDEHHLAESGAGK